MVGNTASGKSHLSALVGEEFGLPVIHLDDLYWRADWSHVTADEFLEAQQDAIAGQKWVIDGCFSEFGLVNRFRAADAVLFLDVSTWSCLRHAISRWGDNRTDTPGDDKKLPLGLALAFLLEMILFWLLDKPRVLAAGRRCGTPIIHIRKWADEQEALRTLHSL